MLKLISQVLILLLTSFLVVQCNSGTSAANKTELKNSTIGSDPDKTSTEVWWQDQIGRSGYTNDSIQPVAGTNNFAISRKSNSQQIYFTNGEQRDIENYATMLKELPSSLIKYNSSDKSEFSNKYFGAEIQVDRSNQVLNKLVSDVQYFNQGSLKEVESAQYYCEVGWNCLNANIPTVYELVRLKMDDKVVGQTAKIHFIDSIGEKITTIESPVVGVFDYGMTDDGKYIFIYAGYFENEVEALPERLIIKSFPDGKSIWETTSLPGEFGPPSTRHNYFTNNEYVIYPSAKLVYYLPFDRMGKIKSWQPDGLQLQSGEVLNFEKDWIKMTFQEFESKHK